MGLTLSQLEVVKQTLAQVPPRSDPTRQLNHFETVSGLIDVLERLQAGGHSIDDLVILLRTNGIDLAASTLRTYLSRIRALHRNSHSTPAKRQKSTRLKQASDRLKAASTTTDMPAFPTGRDQEAEFNQDSAQVPRVDAARDRGSFQQRHQARSNSDAPIAERSQSVASAVSAEAPSRLSPRDAVAPSRSAPSRASHHTPAVPAEQELRVASVSGARDKVLGPGTDKRSASAHPMDGKGASVVRSSSFEVQPDTPDI